MSETKQIEPVPNESTLEKAFTPTPHMRVWLDAAIQSDTEEIKTIAESCGLDRSSWYKWLDLPGFIEWFEAEWNRKLLGHGWKLDTIGLKRAKNDVRYWELMQKRMGRLQENKGPLVAIGAKADEMSITIE